MNSAERYEIGEYSWGSFLGFLFFFPRRLYLPGILHIILLGITAVVIWAVDRNNPEAVKWAIFSCAVVEVGMLTFFGFKANRLSWNACTWKTPYRFISSNTVWGLFGRLTILLRVLNVIGYVFLQPPGGIKTLPGWLNIAGFIFYGILIIFAVWWSRGPIWAVALNTLKESFAKLEVVTLFIIGMVFVILFNGIWHVPAVQDAVLMHFEQSPEAAEIAAGRTGDEYQEKRGLDLNPSESAFTIDTYDKVLYRLRVQAAAFLFGEFFIALICFALGIFLVSGEISRGVVLTVLPKPIGRGG